MISDEIISEFIEQRSLALAYERIAELLTRKLGRRGVRLTRYQKSRLSRWVQSGCEGKLSFRSHEKSEVNLNVSRRELRRMLGRLRGTMHAEMQRAVDSLLKSTPPKLYRQFKANWAKISAQELRALKAFERRLFRMWARPLDLLELLLSLAKEMGADVNDDARRDMNRKNVHLVEATTRLHGRASQITGEIIALLRAGYADGAMARWRSLHEVAVVLIFIETHGEGVAQRYLDHVGIESCKAARAYNQHASRLGRVPVADDEIKELNDERELLMKRYGKCFDEEYGWASVALKHPKPNFAGIEASIELSHWRPHYKLASHNVHANPKGILFRLGMLEGDTVLAGPSNVGLEEAGQNSAISLMQATAVLVQLAPTFDRLCAFYAMGILVDEIEHAFAKISAGFQTPVGDN